MPRKSRLITPSQLSLFSISLVIGAWWEELQAQKLFEGSKPDVSELDQQLFADGSARSMASVRARRFINHSDHRFILPMADGLRNPVQNAASAFRAASVENLTTI